MVKPNNTSMFGNINLRVRPIKLAFLVDPSDADSVRQAIQLNSTLWGGSFNPIIPAYKRMPKVWRDGPLKAPKADAVLRGYIDAFDPDILVQCLPSVPKFVTDLGLRIIKPEEIWDSFVKDARVREPRFGLGIFELFHRVFEEYFKYKLKFPMKVVLPQMPKKHGMFWASVFGEIPKEMVAAVDETYTEALDITKVEASCSQLAQLMRDDNLFPRRITQEAIKHGGGGFRKDAYVFFMDAEEPLDVIDFWNLRALGRRVLPLPKQLQNDADLKKLAVGFIKSQQRPWKHQPDVFDYASIMRSRHTTMEEVQKFADSIRDDIPKKGDNPSLALQHWYPRIWNEWARDKDGATPDTLWSDEKSIDLNDSKRRIQFNTIAPAFAFQGSGNRELECANDVTFRIYGGDDFFAQVLPRSNRSKMVRAISGVASFRDEWRIGRNGLVKLVGYSRSEHWDIPLAQDVFFAWLQDSGWHPKASTPGLITKKIYSQLDGHVRVLAKEKLLELIEHMNTGPAGERELSVAETKNRLKQIAPKGDLHDYLVSKGVFKLGAKVQCPDCQKRSWFSLEDVQQVMTCPRCTSDFPAIGNLEGDVWCYKTAGPFSVPGYADGGYSVLLAIDAIAGPRTHSLQLTPALSFVATGTGGKEMEADFAGFWRESLYGTSTDGVLFAECKTFGDFEAKDFARMAALAKEFPGAVLALCTLKKELTPKEVKEISKIAKRGRKHWKSDTPLNPVLVITGNEILSEWGMPYCWEKAGIIGYQRVNGLLEIANTTQQIYLKLPSWHDEWQKLWEKKRMKRASKAIVEEKQESGGDVEEK